MDEVMNELKESIQVVETYLKHLKDTYAEWIQLNSVSFRPTYKKKKPIKRIRVIKPYNIVITHHKDAELKDLLYEDGQYEGELKHGLKHGKGKSYINGQLEYDGDWKNDLKHGKGKFYINGKLQYEGEWKNDMRNGEGKLYNDSQLIYDGEWKNNMYNGEGKYYKDGELQYEGLCVNNRFIN